MYHYRPVLKFFFVEILHAPLSELTHNRRISEFILIHSSCRKHMLLLLSKELPGLLSIPYHLCWCKLYLVHGIEPAQLERILARSKSQSHCRSNLNMSFVRLGSDIATHELAHSYMAFNTAYKVRMLFSVSGVAYYSFRILGYLDFTLLRQTTSWMTCCGMQPIT